MTTLAHRPFSSVAAFPGRTGEKGAGPRRVLPALRRLLRSAAKGLAIAVPVLLLTSFITFLLGVFAKQQPAEIILGEAATLEDVAELNHKLGLDQPVLVRYATWLGHALQGDLGTSWFTGIPVTDSIIQRFPVSLAIAGYAFLIAVTVGATAGILAAVFRGRAIDRIITVVCSTVATLPAFVVAIALIVIFGVLIPILPTGGYVEPGVDAGLWLRSLTLPAVALSLDAAADIARQLRTGLVGVFDENYVKGARLRGVPPHRVLFVHALRNGSAPAIAVLGLQLPKLIGGAVITEAIFSLPGLGQFARDGAMRGDVPVVIGALLVTVVAVLIASLVVNAVLAILQPEGRS